MNKQTQTMEAQTHKNNMDNNNEINNDINGYEIQL